MYKFITLALICISLNANASVPACKPSPGADCTVTTETDVNTAVPKNLEGATIIVRTKDGKETSVPIEKFKVVPRKHQLVTTRIEHVIAPLDAPQVIYVEKLKTRKNRFSLLGGYGAQGGISKQAQVGSAIEVESKTGLVGGAQYQRLLNDRWSLGLQYQTSKTGSVLLGIDF